MNQLQNQTWVTTKVFACSILVLFFGAQFSSGQSIEELEEDAIRRATAAAKEFTVQIETIGGLETIDGVRTSVGPTTGVSVSTDGFVISSSFNFVGQPASIYVSDSSGERKPAKIVGRDESRKLVLLKYEPDGQQKIPVAANPKQFAVGQTVVAAGRTLASDNINISTGIISATSRVWGRAVQTDAKISPANFGGPLINLKGEVVGILVPMSPDANTELAGIEWYDSGIGFAVPFADVLKNLDQLKEKKRLKPGLMGISFESGDIYAVAPKVAMVAPGTPVSKTGVEIGDVVVAVNGRPVQRLAQLKHIIGPLYSGENVEVTCVREDKRLEFEFALVDEVAPFEEAMLGFLPASGSAAIVKAVLKETPAEEAGLRSDDKITKVGERNVRSIKDLKNALRRIDLSQPLTLEIVRDEKPSTIELQPQAMDAQLFEPLEKIEQESFAKMKFEPISIPEFANECIAIVPDVDMERRDQKPNLLVWLDEPKSSDFERLKTSWQEANKLGNTIILLPRPQKGIPWAKTDSDFLAKMVAVASLRYQANKEGIAIGGNKTGGTLAAITAFKFRNVFRGLFCVDADITNQISSIEKNTPRRFLIFAGQSEPVSTDGDLQKFATRIRQQKIPIHIYPSMEFSMQRWSGKILSWVDSLDRM